MGGIHQFGIAFIALKKKNQRAKTDRCQTRGIHSWIYCVRSKNGQKIPRGKRAAIEIMIMILAKHLLSVQFCDKWATVSGAWWAYAVSFLPVWVWLLITLSFLSFHQFLLLVISQLWVGSGRSFLRGPALEMLRSLRLSWLELFGLLWFGSVFRSRNLSRLTSEVTQAVCSMA